MAPPCMQVLREVISLGYSARRIVGVQREVCRAMLCHAMPCYAIPCYAMPRHAIHAMPCHAMT